jgi:hypothetical protein
MTEGKKLERYWLVVSYVSDGAKKWIEDVGGQVMALEGGPVPLFAVGLAYNPEGGYSYSHGRREHRQGIEHWNLGEIQEVSTGITLIYKAKTGENVAEYTSCTETYLILPDEEFDKATNKVKEPGMYGQPENENYTLDDLDDHPF